VRDDGAVKVLDFGLAKALRPEGSSAAPDPVNTPTMTSPAMTSMGVILGTAAYMAPEQARGQTVDKRADIWAFGVVLYEMLTGRRCFDGATVSDVLAAVLRADIDWSALPADTPRSLRRLLARCLERDPKRRLRDIGDAWTELDVDPSDAPAAGSAPVTIRRPSRLARWLPWVVGVAACGAVVTWAWLRTPPAPARVVTRAQVTLQDRVRSVAVSRDGTRLAYETSVRTSAVSNPSFPALMLRMLDEVDARPIPGADDAYAPLFSPDRRWIAYTQLQPGAGQSVSSSIKKIPITGGTSIALCDGSFMAGAAWGDDDTIVFSGDKGLMRVSAAGGTAEPLTATDGAKGEARHAHPQFLPGGRQLLFTITSTKPADVPQFAVLDLATGRYRVVAQGGGNGRYVKSGHLTYVRGTTLFAVPFDLSRLAVTGDEVPVVEGVWSVRGNRLSGDYSVSDAGLLVYVTANSSVGSQSTLAWASRTGTTEALPGESRQRWGTGRLSPDGRRLANAIHNGDGTSDIWILDVQRGTTTRLTFSGHADDPIWTPDGSRIVYATDPNQKSALYSVPADGRSKPDLLIAVGQPAVPNSFTPDGKTLLYEAGPGSALFRIFVLPLTASGTPGASHPWHEGAGGESSAQVSPDGRWVAYVSNESGQSDVYVQAFSGVGAKWHVSTLGCPGERWSRSSTHDELLYHCGAPNWPFMSVEMPADPTLGPSAPRELFRLQSGGTWDVTPDRDRLLVELVSGGDRPGTTIETVTDWFEELRRLAPAKK
jgi:Tol biopolymer transport system component